MNNNFNLSKENFKKSKEKYKSIEDKILILYKEYENKNRISILLEYWFFNIRSTFLIFGKKGLKEFLKSKFYNPIRYSVWKISKDDNYILDFDVKPNAIKFFLINIFHKSLFLSGAKSNTLLDKVISKITRSIIKSIPINKDLKLREEIVNLSFEYFSDIDIDGLEELILNKLPVLFFSKPVTLSKKIINLNVECAASLFLEFNNYENIFLLNKNIFLKGYQHGGGYDTFLISYFENFEKSLCNQFFGWGLSEKNIRQHRFRSMLKNKEKSSKKRIVWVEESEIPFFCSTLLPCHYFQSKNLKSTEYIYKELKNLSFNYFNLAHPVLPSDKYKKFRGNLLKRKTRRGESIIKQSDIGIFDSSVSTLLYFFVENKMPYIQVIDRLEFELFTQKQKDWINLLRESDLCCFNDEIGRLSYCIEKIMNDNYEIPHKVINFYRNFFKIN